jgi:hypothetical protein
MKVFGRSEAERDSLIGSVHQTDQEDDPEISMRLFGSKFLLGTLLEYRDKRRQTTCRRGDFTQMRRG